MVPPLTLVNAVGSLIPLSQRWCLAGANHRIWRKFPEVTSEMERFFSLGKYVTYLEKKHPFFWGNGAWTPRENGKTQFGTSTNTSRYMRNHHFFKQILLLNRTSPQPMLWTWTGTSACCWIPILSPQRPNVVTLGPRALVGVCQRMKQAAICRWISTF